MLTVSAEIARLLRLRSQRVKLVVEIADTTSPLRYCTGYDPVTYGGEVYQPRAMAAEAVVMGGVDESGLDLVVDDLDRELRLWMFTNGGFSERVVTLVQLHWDDTTHDWRETRSWEFVCSSSSWSRDTHQLRLGSGVGLRPRAGLAIASARCPYNFKGVLCGYAGADTTCQRTLDACTAKSNQTRFGGFQFAPKPGDSFKITSTTTTVYFQGYIDQPTAPGAADDVPAGTRNGNGTRYVPDPTPEPPGGVGGGAQTPQGGATSA